jgi:PAS domain S-box-containing protein
MHSIFCDDFKDTHRDAVLNHIPDLVWMKDLSLRYVLANQAFADAVRAESREAMVGKTDFDLYPHHVASAHAARDREVIASRHTFRVVEPATRFDSIPRMVEITKAPVFDDRGTVTGVVGIARDVTAQYEATVERQQLLDELAEKAGRLSDTIANVPGVVWEDWFDGSHSYCSNHIETLLGYTPQEYAARGSSFLDIVHPDDRARVERTMDEAIAARADVVHQFRVVRKDGGVRWCESHCRIMQDASGQPVGMRGVSMDITDRRRGEEFLRDSEDRFRRLVDDAPVMLWTIDLEGKCDFASRRLLATFHVEESQSEIAWVDALHPDDREATLSAVHHWLQTRSSARRELRVRSADGFRNVLVESAPRYALDGTFIGLIGSLTDITDRNRLEQHLEERKRMAGLGRLAATIAHEMNNVLMGIQPFAAVIARTTDPVALERASVHIRNSIDRGRRITHEILRFGQASKLDIEPIEVKTWMAERAAELEILLGGSIELEIDVEPALHILGDTLQLQQVFTNLVANARDAMNGNGRVVISANRADPTATIHPPTFVHFSIRDTGPGIEGGTIDHIFEPLFTTKTTGTGLGLPIAAEIVEKHGGHILVDGNPGKGAVIHIYLPATTARPSEADTVHVTSLPASVRRVLLVEDNIAVAEGLAALLEMEGVETTVAQQGSEVLEAVARCKPDLVLLDVGLPDMNGAEVFVNIRSVYPSLPILFSTGHGGESELKPFLMEPATGYLLKPYGLDPLVAAIHELIGE